jgi:hypothetical protein
MAPLQGVEPILAFRDAVVAVERGEVDRKSALAEVVRAYPGTVAEVLARGYRLRVGETFLATWQGKDEAAEALILETLFPVHVAATDSGLPKRPLEWLSADVHSGVVREIADQWVLDAWLVSPTLDLAAVASALSAPQFEALAATPSGRLILAREAQQAERAEGSWEALERATSLALLRAAADRDREQAAWAAVEREARATVGGAEPIAALLEEACRGLARGAADDRQAGGALLACAAQRWVTRRTLAYPELTRTHRMVAAGAWDPEVDRLLRVWLVILLKETLDGLEVGRESVLFGPLAVDLLDILHGITGREAPARCLRVRRPDAECWRLTASLIGEEGVTDWEVWRALVGRRLAVLASEALAAEQEALRREALERVRLRAGP